MTRVTFVTWDGPGQTYLESLFLPIFSRLSTYGFVFEIFQLTWATRDETDGWAEASRRHGAHFELMQVPHRALLVTIPSVMIVAALRLAKKVHGKQTDVLLARSIIPAGITLMARRVGGRIPFVFDADGLPADERVEFAGWSKHGGAYRVWRRIEADAVRSADGVIARTARAKQILEARAGDGGVTSKIAVVPNAKDPTIFHPSSREHRRHVREQYGVPELAPWLMFVGSVGPQYHLRDSLELLGRLLLRRPEAKMLILTAHVSAARELVESAGLGNAVDVRRLDPPDVPSVLSAGDVGIAFRAPTLSQCAVSPIKVAEYLLCGLPVLSLRGVGDLDAQLRGSGKSLDGLTASCLEAAVDWIANEVMPQRDVVRERCRADGERLFSIEACAERYAVALRSAVVAASRTEARVP